MVEHCTGIAEDIGSNPVQAWIFFRPYFHYCSSSVHYWEDYFHIHIFIHSSNIWLSCIHSRLLSIVWGKKSPWKKLISVQRWRFGRARIEAITSLNFFLLMYCPDFSQKEGLQIVYCQSQVFHFSFLGLRPVWLIRLDTLLSQGISSPRSRNGYQWTVMVAWKRLGGALAHYRVLFTLVIEQRLESKDLRLDTSWRFFSCLWQRQNVSFW